MLKDGKRILSFLTKDIESCGILVLGDVMLDKYYFGDVSRISPEAPVLVTKIKKEKTTLGGAANVAHNLAAWVLKFIWLVLPVRMGTVHNLLSF